MSTHNLCFLRKIDQTDMTIAGKFSNNKTKIEEKTGSTVIIPSFRTNRSGQTVQTLIRLLL